MFGKVPRLIASASLAALLAGCSSLGMGGDSKPAEASAQTGGTAQIMAQRSSGLSQTAGSLPINVSIKVAKQSGVVTSTVNFGTQAPTTFMHLVDRHIRLDQLHIA